jgi:AAA+ superfamily predicted ATPase
MDSSESIRADASSNSNTLIQALAYVREVIHARIAVQVEAGEQAVGGDGPGESAGRAGEIPPLEIVDDGSPFARFIITSELAFEEYVILGLAVAPHVQPNFLDDVIKDALPQSGEFPELGGKRDREARSFIPTGETALFILAGYDLDRRFDVQRLLTADHWFARDGILHVEPAKEGEPYWSGRLVLNPEFIELFTLGSVATPAFSSSFPAREITTELEWDDLILADRVKEQRHWIEHHDTLLTKWRMQRKLKPGYRVLFYGPPGTGKTLTATLLGKYTDRPVFRVDLSTVVSKYIGETEKNLANLFDRARNKDWILFFDEADALFGKRTGVKDAHDRYANQEVSYLLQRVEEFPGLVILASNFKANIDDAFMRRFNAIVRFPFPEEKERVAIWRVSMPDDVRFEDDVDLPALLAKFELAGGNIINVVQHACLEAIARGSETIHLDDALKGIQREVEKEGKVFENVLA